MKTISGNNWRTVGHNGSRLIFQGVIAVWTACYLLLYVDVDSLEEAADTETDTETKTDIMDALEESAVTDTDADVDIDTRLDMDCLYVGWLFYVLATSKVIQGRVHSWRRYSAAPLRNQATIPMTWYAI